jgi:hypothetical protein
MNTRPLAAALLGALTVAVLAGCTTGPSGDPASSEDASAPVVTTPAADPRLSERGLLPKQIGQEAGIRNDDGTVPVRFTITAAEADPQCQGRPGGVYAEQMTPSRGHFVRLTVDVTTGPGYDTNDAPFASLTWVDPGGYTHDQLRTWNASLCEGDDGLPTAMGPGQRYRGVIVLDVPTTTGTLLVATVGYPYDGGGWEYPITA